MTRITRYGVTLANNPEGIWLTADGEWEVHRVDSVWFCDEPHPERLKGGGGSYCQGNNEHSGQIGWGVTQARSGISPNAVDDVYQTRDEAIAALASYLEKK